MSPNVPDTKKICRICGTRQGIEWESSLILVKSDPVGSPHDTCLVCSEREFTTLRPHLYSLRGTVYDTPPRPWFTVYPFLYPHRLPRDGYERYLKHASEQRRLL